MRQDKLTTRFQQALADAQSLALGRDNQVIEPAHVLLSMLDSSSGSLRPLLMKAGADVNKLRAGLLSTLDSLPKVEGTPGEVHVSNDLNRVLNVTDKLAQQRGDQFISSELFVLAAFDDRNLARLFKEAGLVRGAVEKAIEEVRGGEKVQDANAEESRQALEKYTVDLTARASSGKLDPVIGRDDEIRRTIQVLAAAHQEQSRPDRRAGRRQDRDRRGPGPAHHQQRGARGAEEQAHPGARHGLPHRRREVPRRVRGAPEGRC